jgi:lysophospholipase L1-like esterase
MTVKKMIAYQAIAVIVMLLGAEGLARIAYTFHAGHKATAQESWATLIPDLGWERRRNFNGPDICGVNRTFDASGLVPSDAAQLEEKNPEQQTALFIGDSSTYGFCVDAESAFVEVADRALPQFRMINLGVPAYTSYQGYKTLLKYGSAINPDVIFVSFNFNDRRYVVDENDIDSDATFEKVAGPVGSGLLEQIYLFRLARFISVRVRGLPDEAAGRGGLARLDVMRPRVDAHAYKANLVNIVRWARERGSSVFFILLGDNPNETALLRKGVEDLAQENYPAAINAFEYLMHRPRTALARMGQLYLSRTYAKMGQHEQAEKLLWADTLFSAHGGHPLVPDTDYSRVMRKVADEYGIPLIDAQSELEKTPRVFFDSCHFDAEGHEIVGKLIADVLMKTEVLAAETANTSKVKR